MRIPSRVYKSQVLDAVRNEQAVRGKRDDAKSTRAAETAEAADVKVSVSSEAQKLAADSGIDVQKVNRLKASIADGDFQIDPQRIAERMVDQE